MRILVCGHNGQVAQALGSALQGLGEVLLRGREHLDLANPEQLRAPLRDLARYIVERRH